MDMNPNQIYEAPLLLPRAIAMVVIAALPLALWAWLGEFRTRWAVIASVLAALAAAVGLFSVTTLLLNYHIDWRWSREASTLTDSRISRAGDLSLLVAWYGASLLLVRQGRRRRRSNSEQVSMRAAMQRVRK